MKVDPGNELAEKVFYLSKRRNGDFNSMSCTLYCHHGSRRPLGGRLT